MSETIDHRRLKRATAGLIAASLLVGCSKTVGNGFVGEKNECLPYDATVELPTGDSLDLAAGNMKHAIGDADHNFLKIRNVGDNVLTLERKGIDDGILQVGGVAESSGVNIDKEGSVSVDVSQANPVPLEYREDGQVLEIDLSPSNQKDHIHLALSQSCEASQ